MKVSKVLGTICLGLFVLVMSSCEKDLEQDTDILAGKWRNAKTLNDATLLEEQPWKAKDYVEYAPYNSVRAKRIVTEYTYTSQEEYGYEKNGTYTIKNDTLIRIDNSGSARYYKIISIDKEKFVYVTSMKDTITYLRYN
ncbi:MAG: lipocalin family protein [Bacteroidota bacterium]|nr:lipocalin family protein [Bacteroidota bacterium]